MTDLKIITPKDPTKEGWVLDIDIIDGTPAYLLQDFQNNDQRAALVSYMVQGTIPGMVTQGIDWGSLYNSKNELEVNLIDIDNQIKQNIQNNIVSEGGPSSQYIPQYTNENGQIKYTIMKAEVVS